MMSADHSPHSSPISSTSIPSSGRPQSPSASAPKRDEHAHRFSLADLKSRDQEWAHLLEQARLETQRWRKIAKHWKSISLYWNPDQSVISVGLKFDDSLDSKSMKLSAEIATPPVYESRALPT